MNLSLSEENYLKAIWHLSDDGRKSVGTNELAARLGTAPASITDMVKKLSAKKLVRYEPYQGVKITDKGSSGALLIIRKHRLWETFLVQKLGFQWDEVHEVAEQLEHIQSDELINKLDDFLGRPAFDPHGHFIPDRDGRFQQFNRSPLSSLGTDVLVVVGSIRNGTPELLQYLSRIGIYIGVTIKITERRSFDGSLEIEVDRKNPVVISKEVSQNIFITDHAIES
ncbi:MAG: metal-dependent transcriptional regulator [Cyclobacteriaceae bacterium]